MEALLSRIEEIKHEISKIGEMRPGSLSQQYNICGNPSCRCKAKDNPKKHGPYHQLSYTWKRKSTSAFIKEQDLPAVQEQLANYRHFMDLREEWIDCCLELSKLRKLK